MPLNREPGWVQHMGCRASLPAPVPGSKPIPSEHKKQGEVEVGVKLREITQAIGVMALNYCLYWVT